MKTILTAALCLTACGPVYYSRPGSSEQDFDRDTYECEVQVSRPSSAPSFYPSAHPNPATNLAMASQGLTNSSNQLFAKSHELRLFDKCMRVRGWVKE